jgi:preprotein translocase subunit SecA
MRIFGGEGLIRWMKRFGMKDDDALEDRMISRQIEKAQRKVEQHNFDIRKHLLEFDDVANDQRKVIYRQRDELLEEKHIMLTVVDNAWKDHLANMDYLRQGIYLVGYAQQDPKQAFKRESFKLFSEMLDRIKAEVVQMLARIRIRSEEEVAAMEAEQQRLAERLQTQMLATGGGAPANAFAAPSVEASGNGGNYQRLPEPDNSPKVGRNDPCPCGSGKKYKHCHGQLA